MKDIRKNIIFVFLAFLYYYIIGIDFGDTLGFIFCVVPLSIILLVQGINFLKIRNQKKE